MKAPRLSRLAFIVLVSFVLSMFPLQSLQARSLSYETTWSTDRTLTGTQLVENGEHLTIETGVTVTVACTGLYEVNKIIVEPGGWLTADGVTFQGDGTAGCWGGIEIKTNDDLTTIENSIIRDVQIGLYIEDSSPTIRNNEIYNIHGFDAVEAGLPGYPAYGIWMATASERPTPLIEDNYIHHLTGGAGMAGADGADATLAGATGADGLEGGQGGSAIGIEVEGTAAPVIQGNRIEYLTGGSCGDGGAGGDGAAGENGLLPGDDGGRAGDGGAGGSGR